MNKFIIKEENNQLRLDKALANQTELSRSLLTELIRDAKVLVNGEVKKAKYKVQTGDRIDVEIPKDEVLDIVAEDLPLEIVYEDLQVAVVNKPQGMVVHPAAGHASGTLVNALMYHIKDLSSINGVIRPGIVHRIDKDTSGLLMVAKNDKAHESLAAQLKDKSSKRRYLAIVHGEIPNDKGTIEAPIGRNPKERKKQAVVSGGKPAITHFEVLERFLGYTLVALRLETGRTHQIRVHMNYIGHPVAGDPLYGPNKTLTPNHGQFLHAETLGFEHPTTGEFMEFQAEVPEIFAEQLKKLRGQVE
ncbi:RluA family pseudouridine synthase [Lactococcus taiwanensis]|uniref:RluA family pseudouridine synthase n=1 Tax=Lactococcus taiwanensis TaxID=1151742 RepID=UPI001963D4CC|nr:RluA family pseudouridine synthase [Lactococcus taiwanensis]QRZ11785.1 RluA family pseudouridine synthase [Lactococcus taiwanensis]